MAAALELGDFPLPRGSNAGIGTGGASAGAGVPPAGSRDAGAAMDEPLSVAVEDANGTAGELPDPPPLPLATGMGTRACAPLVYPETSPSADWLLNGVSPVAADDGEGAGFVVWLLPLVWITGLLVLASSCRSPRPARRRRGTGQRLQHV